jgi:hypothetical protein
MKETTVDWVFTKPDPESPGGHMWIKYKDTYHNKKLNKILPSTRVYFRDGDSYSFARNKPVDERPLIKQSIIGLKALFKHYTGKTPVTSNYFALRSLFYQHIYRSFDPEQVINDARDLIGKTIYENPLQLQLQFERATREQQLESKMTEEYKLCTIDTLERLIQMEEFKDFIDWPKYNAMKNAYAELQRRQTKGE